MKPKLSPDNVVAAVCDEFGCGPDLILQKGLKKNLVRDIAIDLSRNLTGESGVNLGKYFGNISGAGITLRYNHLAKQIQFNRRLKGQIKRIKNRIIKTPFFHSKTNNIAQKITKNFLIISFRKHLMGILRACTFNFDFADIAKPHANYVSIFLLNYKCFAKQMPKI